MDQPFEIGVLAFGEISPDLGTGREPSPQQRMRETVEQAMVADSAGLDVFGLGEHHRSDFVVAAPQMVLAGIAERTEKIRLTSGVTVLSSDDPVRVFQDFATLDLMSGGRAEIIAGRGSFTESFPLFGLELADYADLFREKLEALLAIRASNPAQWTGSPHTRDLTGLDIAPRPMGELPIWVGVGGTPASAIRAGSLGLPMALALLLGPITQFEKAVAMYREAGAKAGFDADRLRVSINAHGHVGRTSQDAREEMFPFFRVGMRENNHQRGAGFDLPRAAFDAQATPHAGLLVGSAQEIVDKLGAYHELYGVSRAVFQLGYGGMPQAQVLETIERLATDVAPVVRKELSDAPKAAVPA